MKNVSTGALLGALAGMMIALPAAGADIPKGNHYLCYPVKDVSFKARDVVLIDQFGKWKATLVRPVQLCTPAVKRVEKTEYPVIDSKLHMVCYEVKMESKKTPPVQTADQFGTLKFQAYPANIVCLPAGKTVLKQ